MAKAYFPQGASGVILSLAVMAWIQACSSAAPSTQPPGQAMHTSTKALETGTGLTQGNEPADNLNIYLVGLHPMKDDPSMQVEAHHYCHQVNEDFSQCSLFDGNTEHANLTGVEYIISENVFDTLPEREKAFWHPHNYAILSGQLVAPNMPDFAEKQLMKSMLNTYGKTWHAWKTGTETAPGERLPMGPPMSAWSFNHDGEARPELVEAKDKRTGIRTADVRAKRQDLVPLAHPQAGVNALKGKFPGPATSIPGVMDKDGSAAR